jgi:hypothetical protein
MVSPFFLRQPKLARSEFLKQLKLESTTMTAFTKRIKN